MPRKRKKRRNKEGRKGGIFKRKNRNKKGGILKRKNRKGRRKNGGKAERRVNDKTFIRVDQRQINTQRTVAAKSRKSPIVAALEDDRDIFEKNVAPPIPIKNKMLPIEDIGADFVAEGLPEEVIDEAEIPLEKIEEMAAGTKKGAEDEEDSNATMIAVGIAVVVIAVILFFAFKK